MVTRDRSFLPTVKTEIIETGARMLELPLLVRSVASAESRRISLAVFSPPNLKEEILDVLAPVSIISVFTVCPLIDMYLLGDKNNHGRIIIVLISLGSGTIKNGPRHTKPVARF